ncbi:carboxypeptidase-like regulatory domain-containing protein [Flavobacterium tegetincola]|uniref:carboxypeptidase-like regulatory domain-containing protein n=1 Tax=Flavobacterium tegetincola TaxID=150172 RepID=UPI00040B844B|nr:carboxypeptidase-like regulatory domain-containing protein [Flavobacterium tegetincola]
MLRKLLTFSFLLIQFCVLAQSKVVTILDASTGENIPYANIKVGTEINTVSNSEGKFTLVATEADNQKAILVSYIGYESQQLTVKKLEQQNFIIKLIPAIYELSDVNVTDKKEDANSIMAKVKANINENYIASDTPLKNTVFLREESNFKAKQLKIEVEKSSGFSKSKLKDVNTEISNYIAQTTKNPPREFKDFLGDYSSKLTKKEGKSVISNKLNVLKATTIKDQNRSSSIDELEKTTSNLFLKHLDTTKFYRVKSGWIGSRDTVSFSKSFNEKKKKENKKPEPKNVTGAKSSLTELQSELHPAYGAVTEFMRNTDWYTYTSDGAIFTADYKLVYVIKFKPKKSKASYEGTMYVSENDYAVVKANYALAPGKTLSGINLKLLLGIKFRNNVSRGTLIYKENPETNKYYLHYANKENGQYFYVNRPLKFIELTEGDGDVLALDIKAEGQILNKTEYLNLNQKEITAAEFEQIKEVDFKYLNLRKYDPNIYKEFTVIEPNEEMKQFLIQD